MSPASAVWGRTLRLALVALLALGAATSVGWAWGRTVEADERRFPHEKHARLFPDCETCHAGVMPGDSATTYPDPASCTDCHDGTRQKRVAWNGHAVAPSNLTFTHGGHHREAVDDMPALDCRTCHGLGGKLVFMAVARATPELCLGCHTHKASGHLQDEAPCARCHSPLARATRLSDSAVAAISIPDGHRSPDYLADHAPRTSADAQRCAVCHARESCARCHPNAREVAQISSLDRDARVGRVLRGRSPEYFKPASHDGARWLVAHGDSAKGARSSCANCHARPSCQTCHIGTSASREIAKLAGPDPDGASGVRLLVAPVEIGARAGGNAYPHTPSRARESAPGTAVHQPVARPADTSVHRAPRVKGDTLSPVADTLVRIVRIHPADFVDRHGVAASSGQLNCQGCHEERTCSTCHNGGARRRFHAFNFVSRHAASAVGRERDCTACHNTETFCRECHRGQGREARGSADVAFHDRQPLWLQQHGQAARQEMQTCVTCHQQRDCMRCHADIGLKVNPHGPGFDAERMARRNRQICLACHLSDPLRGRPL